MITGGHVMLICNDNVIGIGAIVIVLSFLSCDYYM